VFVIDTQAWTGQIEIRKGALRQDGKRRARHVIAAAAAAMAVGELLPGLPPSSILPVICFVRDEPIFGWSGDTMICSTENVVAYLVSRPRVLTEVQMGEVAEALAVPLQCAAAPVPPPVMSRSGESPPVPVRRPLAPRKQRLPRPPLPRPLRLVALGGAAAVAVVLLLQLGVPARLGDLGVSAAQRVLGPTKPIGTTVSLPGLPNRPSLDVTAGAPIATRSRLRGVQVTPGHQLVAVPVSLHNTGDSVWRSHSDVKAELTDTTGETYSADPAYTSVTGGRTLPASITLSAQERTRGLVVFEVPRGTEVAGVRLRVGPGLPTWLRWSVG
jgi:hypothetical protein